MSVWVLLQIVLNICLFLGLLVCLIKLSKSKTDDPRLTQGLRLLQSKISILEDLSDHTENQVKQLMLLLDKKLSEVRGTISEVNVHIGEVDRSIEKSRKMAEIIQNEIPHDQIVEKKIENKYIWAAQLAHQGHSVTDIVNAVGLPQAEVELIARINKNNCVYGTTESTANRSIKKEIFAKSLEMPEIQSPSLEQTNLNFHQAVQEYKEKSGFKAIKIG